MNSKEHKTKPARNLKRAIVVFSIVGAVFLLLIGIQEIILRLSGYSGGLFENAPAEYKITGSVMDGKTKQPIEGAKVSVEDYDCHTLTDAKGDFELIIPCEAQKKGSHITAKKEGYAISPPSEIASAMELLLYMEIPETKEE